jgi:hypothetical protein
MALVLGFFLYVSLHNAAYLVEPESERPWGYTTGLEADSKMEDVTNWPQMQKYKEVGVSLLHSSFLSKEAASATTR